MSLLFPKNPKDMNTQELFDMMQHVQKQAKKQNQHFPMYTSRQPAPGAQATAEHMHEDATRKLLTSLFEQQTPEKEQNTSGGIRPSAQEDKRLAQNNERGLVDGITKAAKALAPEVDMGTYGQLSQIGKSEAAKEYELDVDFGLTKQDFKAKRYENFLKVYGEEKGKKKYKEAETLFLEIQRLKGLEKN